MRQRWSIFLGLTTAAAVVTLFASEVWARPGGGNSYSGGSSGGGGGGDDGGALLYFLIRLIFEAPHIGIPVAVVVGYVVFKAKTANDGLGDWESGESIASHQPAIDLGSIRESDPHFSHIRFNDFIYALYARAHRFRHDETKLAELAPYLSVNARAALHGRTPVGAPVQTAAIGAMRITAMTPAEAGGYVAVVVLFESNITTNAGGVFYNHFTHERWTFIRHADVQSKPPGSAQTFNCPNCAAPFTSTDESTCSFCSEVVSAGRFDWSANVITLLSDEERVARLAGHAPERGTQLETVYHPMVAKGFNQLHARDASVTNESIGRRLYAMFSQTNIGWSTHDLSVARPFISDGMAEYLLYWQNAYQQQGLRNITENCVIEHWELVRVTQDHHYDSLVVRLFAHSLDYTINQDDKLISGSKSSPRRFSEYWTLIRTHGVVTSPADSSCCPNCGAALKINMGGSCDFCGAHVTNGEFDWVLSKIEQDESYTG